MGLHLSTPPRNPLKTKWLLAKVGKGFRQTESAELVKVHRVTSIGFNSTKFLGRLYLATERIAIHQSKGKRETK